MTAPFIHRIPTYRAQLFQLGIFVVFGAIYLFFAPNYQWQNDSGEIPYGADFLQEWVGAKMILTGETGSLYGDGFAVRQHDSNWLGFIWNEDQFFPAVYPPPHYLFFTPLATIPYRWAAIVWLFVLLLAAWTACLTIQTIAQKCDATTDDRVASNHNANRLLSDSQAAAAVTHGSIVSERAGLWQYAWLAVLLFPPLLFSITLGQKSALWLLIYSLTAYCVLNDKDKTAGLLFGILSIKPTLFFLLPLVMLRQRRWGFLLGSIVSGCVVWSISLPFVPLEAWKAYLQGVLGASSYAENAGYRIEWSCNLMTIAYCVPELMVEWCKMAICLPLAIYALYTVLADQRSLQDPSKWMMIGCATALLSPHFYQYDLCILLLPTLWLIRTEPNRGFVYFAMVAVAVAISSDCLSVLHLPVLPLLLLGILTELRLHHHLQKHPQCDRTTMSAGWWRARKNPGLTREIA